MIHQHIAKFLTDRDPRLEYAWILNEAQAGPHPKDRVFWTGIPRGFKGPSSAPVKLVQSVFDRYQDQSFFLLRQKIRTTAEITDLDRAVLQLAAKRAETIRGFENLASVEIANPDLEETANPSTALFESRLEQLAMPTLPMEKIAGEAILERLELLKKLVPRGEILHDHNREVAAILTDASGRVLAESVHGGFLNKTLHAETRLAQDFFRQSAGPFPEGSRVYVSLKPCRMCAAMLSQMSEDLRDFRVIYVENDPGRLAQSTLLEKRECLFSWKDLEPELS